MITLLWRTGILTVLPHPHCQVFHNVLKECFMTLQVPRWQPVWRIPWHQVSSAAVSTQQFPATFAVVNILYIICIITAIEKCIKIKIKKTPITIKMVN